MRREQFRKTDFELSELPKTRLEQFFDILKHQTWNLIKVSGLQTVFNMPLIVWFVLFIMAITSVNPEGTFVVILVGGAILVPCLMIWRIQNLENHHYYIFLINIINTINNTRICI